MYRRKYEANRLSVEPMYVPALEGNLRKTGGVCREWVTPSTTEESSVAGGGGMPPSHHVPCLQATKQVPEKPQHTGQPPLLVCHQETECRSP